jgi:hypothetical protein
LRPTVVALILTALVATACSNDPSSTVGTAHIVIGFRPASGGSFSARFNGQTYTSAGGFAVRLSDLNRTYEISGTFTGNSFGVDFATSTMAGVRSGSVLSVEGPAAQLSACGIMYLPGSVVTREFRIQFQLTGTVGLVCN